MWNATVQTVYMHHYLSLYTIQYNPIVSVKGPITINPAVNGGVLASDCGPRSGDSLVMCTFWAIQGIKSQSMYWFGAVRQHQTKVA